MKMFVVVVFIQRNIRKCLGRRELNTLFHLYNGYIMLSPNYTMQPVLCGREYLKKWKWSQYFTTVKYNTNNYKNTSNQWQTKYIWTLYSVFRILSNPSSSFIRTIVIASNWASFSSASVPLLSDLNKRDRVTPLS